MGKSSEQKKSKQKKSKKSDILKLPGDREPSLIAQIIDAFEKNDQATQAACTSDDFSRCEKNFEKQLLNLFKQIDQKGVTIDDFRNAEYKGKTLLNKILNATPYGFDFNEESHYVYFLNKFGLELKKDEFEDNQYVTQFWNAYTLNTKNNFPLHWPGLDPEANSKLLAEKRLFLLALNTLTCENPQAPVCVQPLMALADKSYLAGFLKAHEVLRRAIGDELFYKYYTTVSSASNPPLNIPSLEAPTITESQPTITPLLDVTSQRRPGERRDRDARQPRRGCTIS